MRGAVLCRKARAKKLTDTGMQPKKPFISPPTRVYKVGLIIRRVGSGSWILLFHERAGLPHNLASCSPSRPTNATGACVSSPHRNIGGCRVIDRDQAEGGRERSSWEKKRGEGYMHAGLFLTVELPFISATDPRSSGGEER